MIQRYIPLCILVVASVFFGMVLLKNNDAFQSPLIGQPFGTFEVPDLRGNTHFNSATLTGHVAVVNVFASWCTPCTIEHPTLMKLSTHAKLYGLAWKDTEANVTAYLQKHGNPYEKIGVDTAGKTTVAIGLSGVPETFVLDKKGVIRYHYKSVITEDILQKDILPLIDTLNATAP